MSSYNKDYDILRELGKKVAELANLDEQKELLQLWKKNNGLKPERPMFMIDQICYNEINYNDELTLKCENKDLQGYEWYLRETLYRYNHMRDDRVIFDYINVHKAITQKNWGVQIVTEGNNTAETHLFMDQLENEEDLEKIKMPTITYDEADTLKRREIADEIFDGILKTRLSGTGEYFHYWDQITMWRGMENIMFDLADRPEFIHKLVKRTVDMFMCALDQYEQLGLIDAGAPLIHCTGAYTDELPGFNGEDLDSLNTHSAKSMWTMSAPQLFSIVSPAMHEEFDINYAKPWFERFGLGYYGCCEPNDVKVDVIKKLPNVRKISMSPWVNEDLGASKIGKDYVYSRKPNPSFLAAANFEADVVENEFKKTLEATQRYNCPVEFILKDITTVRNDPFRLWEWAKIAAKAVGKKLD